jgi:hypothetical protein
MIHCQRLDRWLTRWCKSAKGPAFSAMFCAAVLLSCSTQPATSEQASLDGDRAMPRAAAVDSLAIRDDGVGPFTIGLSLDQLSTMVATELLHSIPKSESDTGTVAAVLELREASGRSLLRFGLDRDNRVVEICVLSAAYNTPDGLGVGSTLDELRGILSLESARLIGDELWLDDEQTGLRFRLDATQFALSVQDELDILTLPGTLIVTAVVARR